MKSYYDLVIYQEAFNIALEIRSLTLKLSNMDKFEVGSQIRRSSQSIKDNIVEGYGRRKYKSDFIRFLIISYASLLEAKSQAEFIYEIDKSDQWIQVIQKLDFLGIKINSFIKYVEKKWKT